MAEQGDGALVILPTFNERATLASIVDRVLAQIPRAHVLVIDDGSPDGTGEIADELANDWRVRVIHREGKLGLGTAYLAGFQHAVSEGYRWAIEMDADGSHLPEQLPALLDAARAGAGLVIGARWIDGGRIENWPWYRVCISRIGTAVARGSLRSQLRDLTSGFRVIDTTWLKRVDLSEISSNGYGFQVESAWLLERAGCPVAEVPITFVERADGRSKMSLGIIFEALASVLTWGVRIRLTRREK
ncbi:polyprenol monophosphomannose synthase [Leucobacter denitrificans]|uniref:Polyprenol monophosphomannose synthase n=1 Tax=Leucobacter denitrificans TaxID=683042 RepID=A0A7G9S3P5_9MICO|nr:polyprenol monophosphomannose synthase [Leucobacter denitrificans]QNN62470.1 polyprenol monophosphomannose synthase [Leucobacter denitrificans]